MEVKVVLDNGTEATILCDDIGELETELAGELPYIKEYLTLDNQIVTSDQILRIAT